MAKLKLKETDDNKEIEVGDLLVTRHGERLIISAGEKFYGIDPKTMTPCGSFVSLAEVESFYYTKDDYRIIKGENLTLVED